MRRDIRITIGVAVALAGAFGLGWWVYERNRAEALPAGIVVASGRIEARSTRVAAATGGRVARVWVQEGDRVEAGVTLIELDGRALEAAQAGARAVLAAAQENVAATEQQLGALESRLDLARLEAERYRRLFSRDAAPGQAVDRAESALLQLENEVRGAHAGRQLALRQGDAASAQLRAATVALDETTVLSPVVGFVEDAFVREGEMAAPGMPLLRLSHAGEVTLRVYVPIAEAQRLGTGMEARAWVEGLGDRSFPGTVEHIARDAEFTPRDVHMPDDRTTLVHAVTLRFPNLDGSLKDGFPADAYIRWDTAAPWPARPPWRW
jgi:HlyD family secretion protein